MQVAELIANYIVSEGVTLAAGMSGQQIGPFLDQKYALEFDLTHKHLKYS